jgi:hypothetical protein
VVIVNNIIKQDYPHNFSEVNDKILGFLQVNSKKKLRHEKQFLHDAARFMHPTKFGK